MLSVSSLCSVVENRGRFSDGYLPSIRSGAGSPRAGGAKSAQSVDEEGRIRVELTIDDSSACFASSAVQEDLDSPLRGNDVRRVAPLARTGIIGEQDFFGFSRSFWAGRYTYLRTLTLISTPVNSSRFDK